MLLSATVNSTKFEVTVVTWSEKIGYSVLVCHSSTKFEVTVVTWSEKAGYSVLVYHRQGRQMPYHWASEAPHRTENVVSCAGPVRHHVGQRMLCLSVLGL